MIYHREHDYSSPEYWEGLYAVGPDGRPVDVLLPAVVADLSPGSALDVGCGEVLTLPHHHGARHKWPMAVIVARRPA